MLGEFSFAIIIVSRFELYSDEFLFEVQVFLMKFSLSKLPEDAFLVWEIVLDYIFQILKNTTFGLYFFVDELNAGVKFFSNSTGLGFKYPFGSSSVDFDYLVFQLH